WAIPAVLRLALIENLRRIATRLTSGHHDRGLAADWAERMVAVVESKPTDLILVLADMARTELELSGPFLAELTRHLQAHGPHFALANTWLEQRLSEQGLTVEQLVRADGQAQASDQVSIGNSINGLRGLSSTNWRKFVEGHSVVERELRGDPSGVYPEMDFTTRDRYRHIVEVIARRSRTTELAVAQKANQLAAESRASQPDDRASHVGYYLIGRGRP